MNNIFNLLPNVRKICVSVPIIDDQNKETDELELPLYEIEKAIQKGADLIECRFDFVKNFGKIDNYLNLLSKYKNQSVYTLRSENEGGKFGKDEPYRIALLRKLMDAKPLFVDVEYNLLSNNDEVADMVENSDVRTLVSWHDFEKTPPEEELIRLVTEMSVYSPHIKIVTTAKTIDDSIKMLKLYQRINTNVNLIAFAMGELGIISRILCSVTGNAPFTYASLGAAVAPGQLSIDQMMIFKELFDSKLM